MLFNGHRDYTVNAVLIKTVNSTYYMNLL